MITTGIKLWSLSKRLRPVYASPRRLFFSPEEVDEILLLIGFFTKYYLKTFYLIINAIKAISDLFPVQRERLARKGSVGHSRDVSKPADLAKCINDQTLASELKRLQVTGSLPDLPRAIKYTGALYSIGLPLESIGTGRGRKEADERGLLDKLLTKHLRAFLQIRVRVPVRQPKVGKGLHSASRISTGLARRKISCRVSGAWKKAPDLLYVTLMETLKPSLSQFVSSGHKMLVDEVTQSGSSKAAC